MTQYFPDYGQQPPNRPDDYGLIEPHSIPDRRYPDRDQRLSLATPDDVRNAIRMNPTDPVMRGYIMQRAVELNMTNEIPDDWEYSFGEQYSSAPSGAFGETYTGMAPQVEAQVSLFTPEYNTDEAVLIRAYPDSLQIVVATVVGQRPFSDRFSPDVALQISEYLQEVQGFNTRDLTYAIGQRGVDPTNQMYGWYDIQGQFYVGWDTGVGEGRDEENPEIRAVFYNPSNRMRFTLQDRHHQAGFSEIDDAVEYLENLVDTANVAQDRRTEMPERGQQ